MRKTAFAFAIFAATATMADETLLKNTSFDEFDEKGKPVGWIVSGNFRIAKGAGHNGSGGLVWESDKPCGKLHVARQRLEGVKPGDILEYQALVKKDGFKTAANQGSVFSIEMRDETNKWILARYATMKKTQPDGEWTLIDSSGQVPEGTRNPIVVIYVSGDSEGKVSWDNIVVRKFKREPVAFVCTSVYRNTAAEGMADFHASIRVPNDAKGKAISAAFIWTDADGRKVRTPATRLTDREAAVDLDVSRFAMGRQTIAAELLADGKALGRAEMEFTRVAALPRRRVWIDSYRRCIVDGKPFFPLGMYWNPNEKQMAAYTNGPFNCVIHYEMMTPARLDFCRKAGLMSFSALDHKLWKTAETAPKAEADAARAKLAAGIDAIKDHPALLGWYLGDEYDVRKAKRVNALNRFVSERDPDHPTYLVQDRVYDLDAFTVAADVIGLDPYPVPRQPVRRITDFMRDGRKAVFDTLPHWSVPQSFAWLWYHDDFTQANGRFPTLAEMRSINWQHIACGANGLIPFAYHCFFYPLNRQDWRPLWALAVEACREVARMAPVLLSVEPAPAVTPDSEALVCRSWVKDGDLYVLACNIEPKPLYAAIDLSEGQWRMVGTEIGTPATMDGPAKIRLYMDPIGVSFLRLAPAVR